MRNVVDILKLLAIGVLAMSFLIIVFIVSTKLSSSVSKPDTSTPSRTLSTSIFSIAHEIVDTHYQPTERAEYLATYLGLQTETYGFVRHITSANATTTIITLTEASDTPLVYAIYCDFNAQDPHTSTLHVGEKIKFFGEIKSFSIGPQLEWCQLITD